ncbi:hypothetical protein BH09BAC3_BH09BAC3_01900 [soil metagenome]
MYFPFETLPDHSRIWIYQSNRAFTSSEKVELESGLKALCDQWSAHGTPLHTSFILAFDQFVIMAVDEHQQGASGCSIDGSVRFLKDLQLKEGLDFFDRSRVAFIINGKIELYPVTQLKTLFENQTLTGASITLNNLVGTKAEWRSSWQMPAQNSWLAKYLPKTAVTG